MTELPADFARFWDAYPRHQARKDALKAWGQLQPDAETVAQMLTALDWQRRCDAWLKDEGAYIPLPASWLRGERWTDEPPTRQAPKSKLTQRLEAMMEEVPHEIGRLDGLRDRVQPVDRGLPPARRDH